MVKNKKKSVCKRTGHGLKYLLHPDHTLCCHPDCIENKIGSIAMKAQSIYKLIAVIEKFHGKDDMTNYIVERLLIEMKEKKPPVINTTWLFFTLNRFIRDELIQMSIEDELLVNNENILDSTNAWTSRCNKLTPERILISYDLMRHLIETYGENWALYFSGHIGKVDIMKLEELSYVKFNKRLAEIQEDFEEY